MGIFFSTEDGQVVEGSDGNDEMTAVNNNVTLIGHAGDDTLFGAAGMGNTTMEGGAGIDFLIGNGTNDTASYASSPVGVTVDLFVEEFGGEPLGFGVAFDDGHGSQDALIMIENVIGSDHADSLTGESGANVLQGGAGNDTLTGDGGTDEFKYSFDITAGGGENPTFTEFFAEHGGSVVTVDGDGQVADGTKQGQFSSLYTQWLESLGLTVLDLGQNNSDSSGTPVVEGPDGTFGERESFTWTSGSGKKAVTHERWYSDTWSSGSGGGEETVTSTDGLDTILDFTSGMDKLDFSDITQEQFENHFTVAAGETDTVITMDGSSGWQLTLAGVTDQLAPGDIIFAA